MAAVLPWLTLVGIGEDGVEGLSAAARAAIGAAALVMGGARHLVLAKPLIRGEARPWPSPLAEGVPVILARRGQPVVALASGDPFCFGVGSLLAAQVPMAEILCLPASSAFTLASARLGWAMQNTATISFCGRPVAALRPLLQPGARIIALSADGTTPGIVAAHLRAWGFGATQLTVLEAMGGPLESRRCFRADETPPGGLAPLNVIALEVTGGPSLPLTPGIDEDWFETDGQITKREVRAMTLAALAPRRGERLWDIGAGSGSIGIEWMLRHPAMRAIAVEARADRAARIKRNAETLGVPGLVVREGTAPDALGRLPPPDAVFIGGGAADAALRAGCWEALPSGGRLVINAVTLETEQAVAACHAVWGGRLTRIGIERLEPIGALQGFAPARVVTQYRAVKP
jgi:precorrin-6B C5,15-methyltransferase / cobalt-precorrin-6B C5,C15-methyltransferase